MCHKCSFVFMYFPFQFFIFHSFLQWYFCLRYFPSVYRTFNRFCAAPSFRFCLPESIYFLKVFLARCRFLNWLFFFFSLCLSFLHLQVVIPLFSDFLNFFFLALLSYNGHVTLCKFKVYDMIILICVLQTDHHNKVS